VYPSQILSIRKSSSIDVEVGREMEHLQATFKERDAAVTSRFLRLVRIIKRSPRKP
jgi:hypothetical protein